MRVSLAFSRRRNSVLLLLANREKKIRPIEPICDVIVRKNGTGR